MQKLASSIDLANKGFTRLGESMSQIEDALENHKVFLRRWSKKEDEQFLYEANEKGNYPNLALAVFTHRPTHLVRTDEMSILGNDRDHRHTIAQWCEQYCTDKYATFTVYGDTYFGFYNKTDFSLFRLTWDGENKTEDMTRIFQELKETG
jgi:hypothetical protein